mgnify:CR=1 FL=1
MGPICQFHTHNNKKWWGPRGPHLSSSLPLLSIPSLSILFSLSPPLPENGERRRAAQRGGDRAESWQAAGGAAPRTKSSTRASRAAIPPPTAMVATTAPDSFFFFFFSATGTEPPPLPRPSVGAPSGDRKNGSHGRLRGLPLSWRLPTKDSGGTACSVFLQRLFRYS